MQLEPRRRFLRTALAKACGLAAFAMGFSSAAEASVQEVSRMDLAGLINALRSIGTPACLKAAESLTTKTGSAAGFDLHLRSAGLTQADAQILADALLATAAGAGPALRSFSASYNPDLGDAGAVVLAAAFPESMTELGLVGCLVGEGGGQALLAWAKTAPNLRMICVEDNRFSADLKAQFRALALEGRQILVVV